jgi:hypothetical protein
MRAKYNEEQSKNLSLKSKKQETVKIVYEADIPALSDIEFESLDRLK